MPRENQARFRKRRPTRDRNRHGQALVETALMLPVILILLLGALDLGRVFFTWVGLHQAARIAANAASLDPETTSAGVPALIADEISGLNCAGSPSVDLIYTSAGMQVTDPQLGDYARVTIVCSFNLLTPLADQLFGAPIALTAVSSFPVRTGCLNCGTGTGGSAGGPPPPQQCRTIPDLTGLSVAGARLAWESAGFTGDVDAGGASEYATVDPDSVIIDPEDPSCPDPLAIFQASVTVATIAPDEGTGCEVLPNMVGLAVSDARAAWQTGPFADATFLPPEPDADSHAVVVDQATSPTSSQPGVSCLVPGTDVTQVAVALGDAWPDPPPAPCHVPHMIDKNRSTAQADWFYAGFAADTFSPTTGNFKIKWQSLVGLSWVSCDSQVTVDNKAP